jgi:hypothetical protein
MNCTHEHNYYNLNGSKVCGPCLVLGKLGATPDKAIVKDATRYYARSHSRSVVSVRASKIATESALVEYINDGHA